MNTFWFIILIFTLLTGVIFGFGGFLLHLWFFKPSNNPNKARIYLEGVNKPYEGFLIHTSRNGSIYNYDKVKKVFVPSSYKVEYHYFKRLIWLDKNGSLIALPVSQDKPLTTNDRNDLIRELVESKIGAEAVRSIKARSSTSMLIVIVAIIVAIFAGVIGFAIAKNITSRQSQPVPVSSQPAPAPTPQPNIIIEGSGQVK